MTFAAVAAFALLLEPELASAEPPIASAIAAAPTAMDALLECRCVGCEGVGGEGDEVDQGVDSVGMVLTHGAGDVAV